MRRTFLRSVERACSISVLRATPKLISPFCKLSGRLKNVPIEWSELPICDLRSCFMAVTGN